jgi:hypothetical protein
MKLAITIALAGCTGGHAVAPSPPNAEVRIVRHADAIHGEVTKIEPLEVPFGQGQNGSELVLGLLHEAQEAGATYVTDLTFHMVFKRRGVVVECETNAVFRDDPALRPGSIASSPEPAAEYSTDVANLEPHAVSFTAVEPELGCKKVAVAVSEDVPRYANLYDVDIPRIIDTVPVDHVVHLAWHDACELKQVKRPVTRFDYQARLAYVPPRWNYIGARYAGEPLIETPPLCDAVDPATLGPHPVHRLTATLVFHGGLAKEPMQTPRVRSYEWLTMPSPKKQRKK